MRTTRRHGWIAERAVAGTAWYLGWIAAAAGTGFAVSGVAAALLALPRGWFVLVHVIVSGGLVVAYCRSAGIGAWLLWRRWPLGLALAAAAGGFSVDYVLSQPPSPGVEGPALLADVAWLGAAYGLVDAMLLTVLPAHAAWSIGIARGWVRHWPGAMATAAAALAASIVVTAAYHAGFPEFQGPAIVQPVFGNLVFSLAYVLSANPVAPVIAHVALHVAAVLHAHGASIPLPPHY